MDFKIKGNKATTVKTEGAIQQDGSILVSSGQVMPECEDFLKKAHNIIKEDFPVTQFSLEDGVEKTHLKFLNGPDFKTFSEEASCIFAFTGLLEKMNVAKKLENLIDTIRADANGFTYAKVEKELGKNVDLVGQTGNQATDVITEVMHTEL